MGEEACPCMSSPPREGGCRSAPAWAGVRGSGIGPSMVSEHQSVWEVGQLSVQVSC